MDVKDLRTEPALSERNNDGSKYTQGGSATLQCNRNKSYQDIGSNPLAKAEGAPVRPCAVIGPDRVVPPPATSDAFLKKGAIEPWPSSDNGYRRAPEYSHRLHPNPARNISPRQTFQENMQRINVPPTFSAVRHSDSANFNHNMQDRSVAVSKNAKPNMAPEAKYCDVPYALNALPNEPKNVRDPEMYVPNVNSQLTRSTAHIWPPGSVSVNPPRTFSVTEPYQYPQYTSCAGQRPPTIPMARPYRTIREDPAYVYPENYYQDPSGHLKHYPPIKERCPQPRYEYLGNYAGQFHPPHPMQPLKYDIPKPGQTHPYSVFPHFKYLESRVPDPNPEGYQRSMSHQPPYNLPYRTQVIHPTYAQVPGAPQKVQPYPSDGSVKAISSNKLHYENGNKMYIDYDSARTKPYPIADNYYVNDMSRFHPHKSQMVMPNYSQIGMRAMPSQQYYLKDNTPMKPIEYMPTFRNFEPHLTGNPMLRHAPQFSPNTLAISPTDSNTSNDTSQTHGTSQEDCGYVSQSSTTSVRSVESGIYRLPHEYYKRHDFRYGQIVGNSHTLGKTDLNSKDGTKQKQINVRQFLQMWNEGEEENPENNNSKEIIVQTGSSDMPNFPKHVNSEDQLYVLGLVNVPSEELGKYEHIEKISKLPENIKGYNNLELFSRFEEAMESCNSTAFKAISKDYPSSLKDNAAKIVNEILPRPVSPLDVEAKISQSVIHKEVGCNFEIKPCSPKMLNVEVAAPAQNVLGERSIEKVSNPLSKIVKSPLPMKPDENSNCHPVIRQDNVFTIADNPSCKMIQSPFMSNTMDSVKTNYSLQDLEINSGVCLASLPQLDNEIELNFPEVNQQFINANKKDGFSSPINSNQCNSSLPDNRDNKFDSETSKIVLTECDKTINKLSKYRKAKTTPTDSSEVKNKAIRTDSVIIKNPENIENKILENSFNMPMNLSSQSAQWYNNSPHEVEEIKDNEIALDFSLNKCTNDLPIIETGKDMLIKQFEKHLHSSCDNVVSADTDMPCQENALDDNIAVDPKTSEDFTKESPSHISCIQSSQDISRQVITPTDFIIHCKNAYVNEDTVNSKECFTENINAYPKVANEYNHYITKTGVENKTVVDEVVTPVVNDIELANKNKDSDMQKQNDGSTKTASKIKDTHKDIDLKGLQVTVKKDDNIVKNTVMTNDKDSLNKFSDPQHHTTSCFEALDDTKVKNPVTQIVNLDQCKDINKNKLFTVSQNENDFEHDEISASLEKLFRESNEETLKYVDNSSNKLVSNTSNKTGCHQSKELYSPWIQKLLTHSEGSYPCDKIHQKGLSSIFDPDECFDKPDKCNIDYLKNQLEQDMEVSHSETISKFQNILTIKKRDVLVSDTIQKPESKVSCQTVADVTDCLEKDNVLFVKNELLNKPEPKDLNKEHNTLGMNKLSTKDSSNQIINNKESDYQDVETSKRKAKKRKSHCTKLTKKMSKRDKKDLKHVNSVTETSNCINNLPKQEESEESNSRENKCHIKSTIKRNVTGCSNNFSGIVSDNRKDRTVLESGSNMTENVSVNCYSVTPSEILNSNVDFKPEVLVQSDFKSLGIDNDDQLPSTNNKIDANSIDENVTESITEDQKNETDEMSLDSCSNNSATSNNYIELNCGSLSISDSDISNEVCSSVPLTKNGATETANKESVNICENKDAGKNLVPYEASEADYAVVKNSSHRSPESMTNRVPVSSSDGSCIVVLNKHRICGIKDDNIENISENYDKEIADISVNNNTYFDDSAVLRNSRYLNAESVSNKMDVASSNKCSKDLIEHNIDGNSNKDNDTANIFKDCDKNTKKKIMNISSTCLDDLTDVKNNIPHTPENSSKKGCEESSDVSCKLSLTKHKTDQSSSKEDVIDSVFDSCYKDMEVSIKNSENSSVLKDSAVLQKDDSKRFPMNDNQEQKPFNEDMIASATINNIVDNLDDKMTNDLGDPVQNDQNISGKLCSDVVDNFPKTKEPKIPSNLDDMTKNNDNNNKSESVNITKSVAAISSTNNYLSHETKNEEGSLARRINDAVAKEELYVCNCDLNGKNHTSCSYNTSVLDNNTDLQRKGEKIKENLVDLNRSSDGDIKLETDLKIVCSDTSRQNTKADSDRISANCGENKACIDFTFQENRNDLTPEVLSHKSSAYLDMCEAEETASKHSISSNVADCLTVSESNLSLNKSHPTNIELDNSNQKSQDHCNIKQDPQKNEHTRMLLVNNEFDINETLPCDTPHNFEENETLTKNNDILTTMSSEECDDGQNSEPEHSIQKHENNNVLTNHPDSLSSQLIENHNEPSDEVHSPHAGIECVILFENNKGSVSASENLIQEHENNNVLPNLSDSLSNQLIENHNEPSDEVHSPHADIEYVICENNKGSVSASVLEDNLDEFDNNLTNVQETCYETPIKRSLKLKRSYSDSALNSLKYKDTPDRHFIDNTPMWPPKRQKMFEIDPSEQQVIDENLCNFIQNRRNSISSYYNAENVSFCILIDNDCILTEENEDEKICYAEVSEECITELNTSEVQDNADEVICESEENELEYSNSVMLDYSDEKSIQESWLDDVACVETVVSDDVVEDADNDVSFSTDVEESNYDESGIFTSDINELAHGINFVKESVPDNVSEFENIYQTPPDDDKIILYDEEPQYTNNYDLVYSGESMEEILSESYRTRCSPSPTSDYSESILLTDDTESKLPEDKENIFEEGTLQKNDIASDNHSGNRDPGENNLNEDIEETGTTCSLQHDETIILPESSIDNIFSSKKQDTNFSYATSSSPEVSSTTFEEKSSSILLKITNFNGSRVSEINEINHNRPRCKFTESKDYSNSQGSFPKKPLITKAAQKYIPPLKESIRDLKVKLPLPQQRLLKLKQLKLTKSEPKNVVKQNILTIPKKQKPKLNFEDVLKNIDEVQIKMHKQNSKKSKNVVPKVVIKKNLNGSHYTSSSKEKFNPDLTGRKWQPWVFLERNRFIDSMAMRNKTKAIFSHRKNTYVLADQFKKYKSVSNCAKFVISQPKVGNSSKGQLKYTIRLKHS